MNGNRKSKIKLFKLQKGMGVRMKTLKFNKACKTIPNFVYKKSKTIGRQNKTERERVGNKQKF